MSSRIIHPTLVFLASLALLVAACAPAQAPAPPPARDFGMGEPEIMPTPMPVPREEGAAFVPVSDRLVIKTATLTLIVKDVQESISQVTAIATEAGGFVVQSKAGKQADKLVATITIRVPVAAFEATLDKLRKVAVEVNSESLGGQDVTEEYTDLEAQLRNLQATEKQLLNLLERAQTVEDTLKVYNQLTDIRGRIERLQGRMNYLQKSAAMSTITVNLRPMEEKPIVKTGKEAWQPLETLKDALRAMASFLQFLADLAIWLLVFSPLFLAPVLVLWLIWRWTRRHRPGPK